VRGTLTVGYGHTSAAGLPRVYPGMVVTAAQADAILASDLAAVEMDIRHHVTREISQSQFDCLVSFDFNTGALARSNVLRAVNAGMFGAVPADLLMWDHAGGHVLPGLYRRRIAEGVMFRDGVYKS
jgi:lysozyme